MQRLPSAAQDRVVGTEWARGAHDTRTLFLCVLCALVLWERSIMQPRDRHAATMERVKSEVTLSVARTRVGYSPFRSGRAQAGADQPQPSPCLPTVTLSDGNTIPALGFGTSFFTDAGMDLRRATDEGSEGWTHEMNALSLAAVDAALTAVVCISSFTSINLSLCCHTQGSDRVGSVTSLPLPSRLSPVRSRHTGGDTPPAIRALRARP